MLVLAVTGLSLALSRLYAFACRPLRLRWASRGFFTTLLMSHVIAEHVRERSGCLRSGLGHGFSPHCSDCLTKLRTAPGFQIISWQEKLSCTKLLAQSLPRQLICNPVIPSRIGSIAVDSAPQFSERSRRTYLMHYDVKNYEMDMNVGRLVAKIHLQFRRCLDAELAKSELELTSSQWIVLMNLGKNTQQTAAELASLLHQDTGAMTRMLDRLQAKGLVKRSRSSTDRRVVHVELSEAGRRLFPQLPKVSATVLNRILADFSAKEVQQLTKLLSRVLESATACAQGPKS